MEVELALCCGGKKDGWGEGVFGFVSFFFFFGSAKPAPYDPGVQRKGAFWNTSLSCFVCFYFFFQHAKPPPPKPRSQAGHVSLAVGAELVAKVNWVAECKVAESQKGIGGKRERQMGGVEVEMPRGHVIKILALAIDIHL